MIVNWLDRHLKWVFTLPAVLFIGLMIAFPIVYTGKISLYEWSMSAITPPKWVGLDNYAQLLKDPKFWNSMGLTLYHSSVSILLETVLGVAVALLFSRPFAGKRLVKTVMMLPMVATPVSIGLVWLLIYEPSIGLANQLLRKLGLSTQEWLGSVTQVMPSLILIDVWEWTPMIALIVIAGLATLPSDPYESADVDGATSLQKLVHITLPLLLPTIMTAVILRIIDLLKTFDTIYATTQGGPNFASQTLNLMIFDLAFVNFKLGSASALLILFFLLILAMIFILMAIRKRLGGLQ
ncbi:sugar ABC transporter permease [Paenibacillus filicis]|uniref:Sugar ABC transporter permease n=1 Tax=Paenibacillus gyeongsangnamensis TaxID=3388067 RepID=A0ABT4QIZ5_9BACL|nr:sugar ABC transporter permease [Paenibacillus filicis]MCZ8516851.1 sugar ABC transporter permease [Paenibacillus filicis]